MSVYDSVILRGKTLAEWAGLWFSMSNDAFFAMYGFNFNPHEYPGLYELAQKRQHGAERDVCRATNLPCSHCNPGGCVHRLTTKA